MKTKRFFLTGVVILALIGHAVNESYAHPVAVISSCATGKEVCVDSTISFKGNTSYDTDEGGSSIVDYEWSWPTEAYGESGQGTDTFTCKFSPVSSASGYKVYLRVKDDENVWSTWKSCTVYVVEVVSVMSSTDTVHLGCNDDIMFTVTTNPPSHYDPITWSAPGGDPPFQSGGETFITHWDDPGAKTVTATCGSSSENKQVYVVGVSTVEWETFSDNTPLDNNKIFPGKKDPGDISWDKRRKVWVKVTLVPMPQAAFGPIYCSCWDPDDPSADPTLDTNGDAGGDNFNDGTGLNKAGEIIFAPTNASGAGHWFAQFQVSRQPGNNFTIAVSTCEDRLDELTQPKLDSGDIPRSVELSPVLTTWRKLWIERDSMEQVVTTGGEKNHIDGTMSSVAVPYNPATDKTVVWLGLNLIDNEVELSGVDCFRYGRYIVGGNTHLTTNNTSFDPMFGWDRLTVRGNHTPTEIYELYDDDEGTYGAGGWIINPLLPQKASLGTWASKFEAACIKPNYLPDTYYDEVPFDRNLDSMLASWGWGSWNNDHDCSSSSHFWTVLVVSGFQPQYTKDKDPDDEIGVSGVARASDDNQCLLYLETNKEVESMGGPSLGKVMAHEIGHTGGPVDNGCEPGCLMWQDATGHIGDHFCGKCLKDFRKDSNW